MSYSMPCHVINLWFSAPVNYLFLFDSDDDITQMWYLSFLIIDSHLFLHFHIQFLHFILMLYFIQIRIYRWWWLPSWLFRWRHIWSWGRNRETLHKRWGRYRGQYTWIWNEENGPYEWRSRNGTYACTSLSPLRTAILNRRSASTGKLN